MDIPLSIKLSILLDVSYGLLYLHTLPTPIIHRDLSANNILLTADGLQAKIADLGVSKLLDLQTQTKIAQTKVPGSQNYMPPEALTENPEYGLKLDIFSFGHLMLYTATQEFPAVHEVTLTPAILEQGIIQLMKRRKAISKMGSGLTCLKQKACLLWHLSLWLSLWLPCAPKWIHHLIVDLKSQIKFLLVVHTWLGLEDKIN